jgi:hypothetical protein
LNPYFAIVLIILSASCGPSSLSASFILREANMTRDGDEALTYFLRLMNCLRYSSSSIAIHHRHVADVALFSVDPVDDEAYSSSFSRDGRLGTPADDVAFSVDPICSGRGFGA